MANATFRFHDELERFLAPAHRGRLIARDCARAATLKNAIEALGVPHTEVGRLAVNGAPATLARIVREGDAVEVFPPAPGTGTGDGPLAFIADAHLGGLARMLRMLGFDTLYDNGFHDPEIIAIAARERRIVLSRDRELLKCREIARGAYVHALKPEAQLRELAARYALERHMRPFTLCLECNLPLTEAARDVAQARIPDRIFARYARFMHCAGCNGIFWEGSHWERMRAVLAATLETAV